MFLRISRNSSDFVFPSLTAFTLLYALFVLIFISDLVYLRRDITIIADFLNKLRLLEYKKLLLKTEITKAILMLNGSKIDNMTLLYKSLDEIFNSSVSSLEENVERYYSFSLSKQRIEKNLYKISIHYMFRLIIEEKFFTICYKFEETQDIKVYLLEG